MLPSNSSFDFDSSDIIPTGWGSAEEDEADDPQTDFDLVDSVQPIAGDMDDDTEPVVDERFYDDDSESYSSETNQDSDFNEPNLPLFYGSFYEAKAEASDRDRWLLVNVQASGRFESWPNLTVQSHFVFWQINEEDMEGQKVCCFYKLKALPATMVVDPITGEKLLCFEGTTQPEDLLADLMRFSDKSPKERLNGNGSRNEAERAIETGPVSYPPLGEEPAEKEVVCRVGIWLPDGRRVRRSFLRTDPTKLLWSFCATLLREEESRRSFWFLVPSSSKLFYSDDGSFEEAGLSNALLRLCWGEDD